MIKGYKIDVLNNKVYLTASFLRAASRLGTPEYNELLALRRELPDYGFQKAETDRKKTTNKNKNLTYAKMRDHIKAVYGETQKADEMLKIVTTVAANADLNLVLLRMGLAPELVTCEVSCTMPLPFALDYSHRLMKQFGIC